MTGYIGRKNLKTDGNTREVQLQNTDSETSRSTAARKELIEPFFKTGRASARKPVRALHYYFPFTKNGKKDFRLLP